MRSDDYIRRRKAGLGHDVCNAWPVLQSSFHFIVVADDSYAICMIFRSQGGCGRQTAGSAGDDPEEEEVVGREPRPEGQGGCEVQGSIRDEKGLVKMSFNFSLY